MSTALYCAQLDYQFRKPRLKMSPGAIDCHAHICRTANCFPCSEQRIYTPHDVLLPDYWRLLGNLGVQRAVLVQPCIYSEDSAHRLTLSRLTVRACVV